MKLMMMKMNKKTVLMIRMMRVQKSQKNSCIRNNDIQRYLSNSAFDLKFNNFEKFKH